MNTQVKRILFIILGIICGIAACIIQYMCFGGIAIAFLCFIISPFGDAMAYKAINTGTGIIVQSLIGQIFVLGFVIGCIASFKKVHTLKQNKSESESN